MRGRKRTQTRNTVYIKKVGLGTVLTGLKGKEARPEMARAENLGAVSDPCRDVPGRDRLGRQHVSGSGAEIATRESGVAVTF